TGAWRSLRNMRQGPSHAGAPMTPIPSTLAHEIARLVHAERLAPGAPLTERRLAERFLVSRSPIRTALRELQRAGVLAAAERGGFKVADPLAAKALAASTPVLDGGEEVYLAIARDRLAGAIPDRMSENELLR